MEDRRLLKYYHKMMDTLYGVSTFKIDHERGSEYSFIMRDTLLEEAVVLTEVLNDFGDDEYELVWENHLWSFKYKLLENDEVIMIKECYYNCD